VGLTNQPITFYEDPAVYDILHAKGTAGEVDGLESIVMRSVRTRSRRQTWLEPACGTGRYLRVALSRGTRVVGVDRSGAMLDYAAKRLGKIDPSNRDWKLVQGGMEDLGGSVAPESIDFAFNPINSIRHLETDRAMLDHLAGVARALKPGGIYAVGMSIAAYRLEQETEDVWEGRRGRCTVRQTAQYIPPQAGSGGQRRSKKTARAKAEPKKARQSAGPVGADRFETVISHLEIIRPSGAVHQDSTYRLRTYSREQWLRLLGRSAMELVATTDDYGEPISIGAPGYGVWLLKRK
jgi:ubiquinone/menaquinone biosynthesis C-methylase UbiE